MNSCYEITLNEHGKCNITEISFLDYFLAEIDKQD